MPWANHVPAIVMAFLPGQADGQAIAVSWIMMKGARPSPLLLLLLLLLLPHPQLLRVHYALNPYIIMSYMAVGAIR